MQFLLQRKKIQTLFEKKWEENKIHNKEFGKKKTVDQPPCPQQGDDS